MGHLAGELVIGTSELTLLPSHLAPIRAPSGQRITAGGERAESVEQPGATEPHWSAVQPGRWRRRRDQ